MSEGESVKNGDGDVVVVRLPYRLRLRGGICFMTVGSQWKVLSRGMSKSDLFLQGMSLASLGRMD